MSGIKGMQTGGQNKRSIAEMKRDGTYREDRHSSYVDATKQQLTNPDFTLDRELIFSQWANRIHTAGLGQEQDAVVANQLTELTLTYNYACSVRDQDPEAKIGNKLAITVIAETAKDIRMVMNEYRMSPGTREPTVDGSTDSLDKLLEGPVQ